MGNFIAILGIIIGAMLCFGGIYFKVAIERVISTILGIVSGAMTGLLVGIVFQVTSNISAGVILFITLAFVVLFTILANKFTRIFYALMTFVSATLTSFLLIILIASDLNSLAVLILLANVIGIIFACVVYKLEKYSFILCTALLGATMMVLNYISLKVEGDFSEIGLSVLLGDSATLSTALVAILALAALGTINQIAGQSRILPKLTDMAGHLDLIKIKDLGLKKCGNFVKQNLLSLISVCVAVFVPLIIFRLSRIDASNFLYEVGTWVEPFAVAFLIATVIYLLNKDKVKQAILTLITYDVINSIFNYGFIYSKDYGWKFSIDMIDGTLTGLVLIAVYYLVKDKELQLAISPLIGYLVFNTLTSILYSKSFVSVDMNLYSLVSALAVYGMVVLIYYKANKELPYKNKKSIIALLIVALACSGFFGVQKWIDYKDAKVQNGGWQNYKQEAETYQQEGWEILDKKKLVELIDGDITYSELKTFFWQIQSPIWQNLNIGEIAEGFKDYPSYITFDIWEDSFEETGNVYDGRDFEYKISIDSINNKMRGLTKFRYKKNTYYSQLAHTDDNNLYVEVEPNEYWDGISIKNIRGRYNDDKLVIDFDLYDEDYDHGIKFDKGYYTNTMRAIFKSTEGGKYVLVSIVESDSEGPENCKIHSADEAVDQVKKIGNIEEGDNGEFNVKVASFNTNEDYYTDSGFYLKPGIFYIVRVYNDLGDHTSTLGIYAVTREGYIFDALYEEWVYTDQGMVGDF